MNDAYLKQDEIPKIDIETLKQLSTLKPWRSLSAILIDWVIIVLCIVLCEWWSYWFYPLAFVIVGSRFHGLEAMMHEAAHFRLHSNRKINEFIGELSVWPVGLSLLLYRNAIHFSHHQHIGTLRDAHIFLSYERHSDRFDVPKPLHKILKSCFEVAVKFPKEVWLGQISGIAKLLPRFSKSRAKLWGGFQVATWVTVVVGSAVFTLKLAGVYLLFFVLPLMWVAVISRYLRLLAEHFGIPSHAEKSVIGGSTRTVLVPWPVRILFWPHKINYHLEHHWYPSVPFYNLPALHKILQESPEARQKMHLTKGVKNLFRELTAEN